MDRLDALLRNFSVSSQMFHSGVLCGVNDFAAQKNIGQLHLLRAGVLHVEHERKNRKTITEPSLLFYPRPLKHRFIADDQTGVELVCANIVFNQGEKNLLIEALPKYLILPLRDFPDTRALLEVLFNEAFHTRCGGKLAINRLFEVVIIHILRWLMDKQYVSDGLLAGMAHPQLAKSLVALHEDPAHAWSLESLANAAGMSRSVYASSFKTVMDQTPMDYLAQWRLGLAQKKLLAGKAVKQIVIELGYGSDAAFSRAFKARCRLSPKQWQAKHLASLDVKPH